QAIRNILGKQNPSSRCADEPPSTRRDDIVGVLRTRHCPTLDARALPTCKGASFCRRRTRRKETLLRCARSAGKRHAAPQFGARPCERIDERRERLAAVAAATRDNYSAKIDIFQSLLPAPKFC